MSFASVLANILHNGSSRNRVAAMREGDYSLLIRRGQPIEIFIALIRLSCWILLFSLVPIRALAFDYFEHRYLGNNAYLESTKNRATWSQKIQDDLRLVEKELGFIGLEREICDGFRQPTNGVKGPTLPTFCTPSENAEESDSKEQALGHINVTPYESSALRRSESTTKVDNPNMNTRVGCLGIYETQFLISEKLHTNPKEDNPVFLAPIPGLNSPPEKPTSSRRQ